MASDNLLKPFDIGFRRKLNMSHQADNKFSVTIVYYSPEGNSLANKKEIREYLKQKEVPGIDAEDFSFAGHPIHKEPYEVQSWGTSNPSNSVVAAATVTQGNPQDTNQAGSSENPQVVLELKADPDANDACHVVDVKPRRAEMSPYIVVKPDEDGVPTADQLAMMNAYYPPKVEVKTDHAIVKTEVPAPVGFIESPDRIPPVAVMVKQRPAVKTEPAASPVKPGLKRPLGEREKPTEELESRTNKKQRKDAAETVDKETRDAEPTDTSSDTDQDNTSKKTNKTKASSVNDKKTTKATKKQAEKTKLDDDSTKTLLPVRSRKAAIAGRQKIKKLSTSGMDVAENDDDSDRDANYTAGSDVTDDSDMENGASPPSENYSDDNDSDFDPVQYRRTLRGKKINPVVNLTQLSPKQMMKWTKGGVLSKKHVQSNNNSDKEKTKSMSNMSSDSRQVITPASKQIAKHVTNEKCSEESGSKPSASKNVSSHKTSQKGELVKSVKGTSNDDNSSKRIEILTLGKKEFKLHLPVSILPSVNECSKPEMRSLYAGDPGRDWVKVLGKVKGGGFLYQCMFCSESRKEPKLISSHQLHSHKRLLDMMGSLKPGKSQIFLFCRHCEYIAMQKSVMWHHMQSMHDVDEILLPEADPEHYEIDKRSLGYIDQKKIFYCPVEKCNYKTHYNPEIIEHMLRKHRSTDFVYQGFVHIRKAKLPPYADQQDDAFMCNMCQFVTFQSFLMEVHCMEAHAKKFMLYSCLFCDEQFIGNSISRVEKHLLDKHKDTKVKVSVTVIDSAGVEDQDVIDSRKNEGKSSPAKKTKEKACAKPSKKSKKL